MTARNRAAYCTFGLSCTVSRIEKPLKAKDIGNSEKAKRCFRWSEIVAIAMAKTKAQAQGGTEYSCVWIAIPCEEVVKKRKKRVVIYGHTRISQVFEDCWSKVCISYQRVSSRILQSRASYELTVSGHNEANVHQTSHKYFVFPKS